MLGAGVEDGERGGDPARAAQERAPVDTRPVRGFLGLGEGGVRDVSIVSARAGGDELAVGLGSRTEREHSITAHE
jgi:hypothetical protein